MRIPDWSIAAGNPCRVLRKITEDDRRKEFHNKQIDEEAWKMICGQEKNNMDSKKEQQVCQMKY